MRLDRLVLVGALAFVFVACTKDNPNYCADAAAYDFNCRKADAAAHDLPTVESAAGDAADAAVDSAVDMAVDAPKDTAPVCTTDDQCSPDAGTPACDSSDGGARCVECTKNSHCGGANPVCDTAKEKCVPCTGAVGNAALECKLDPMKTLCAGQSCVECIDGTTCPDTKPLCDAHTCRPCASDAECGGPGICLEDGSCPAATKVIYVEFNSNGCTGADGTSAKPFCNPSDAVTVVGAERSVIVIRGPASGPIDLSAAVTPTVTIVGRKNADNEAATIPLGVFTGVKVASNRVVVRDLTIAGGTSSGVRGVLASGPTTSVILRRVTVDTGTGLGAQADTGASLVMDQCIVKDNAVGGLLVNVAFYSVTNSVFANNGYGVKLTGPKPGSTFAANTVVGNAGNATTCDSGTTTLVGSLIVGFNDTCSPMNSVTVNTPPTFDAARPFHLTAHLPCTGGAPAMPPVPAYDLDGDPRIAPLDCGADQFK